MDGTILQQGTFVVPSTVVNQIVQIPANADWMVVRNFTQFGAAGTTSPAFGIEFEWQRGMAAGSAIVKYKTNSAETICGDTIPTGGFTLYDPSGQSIGAQPLLGPAIATTASTNVTKPVVSTSNTAGIVVGSVVRMSNTAQTDVNGIDMVVGAVSAGSSFTLLTTSNALATAPGAIGGAGFYRIVNTDSLFYPRRRYVTNIVAATGTVSTAIAHGLTPGQAIRFSIPPQSGMTQLNSTPANNYQYATVVTVIDDYSFTIDINTSGFTAFTWPTIAQQPSQFPFLDPVGENTALALSSNTAQVPTVGDIQIFNTNTGILADSTVNTGYLGMILGTGGTGTALTAAITGPAGSAEADVMYWVAGKSTYGGL